MISETGLTEIARALQNTSLQTLWLEDASKSFIEAERETQSKLEKTLRSRLQWRY